jgi:hypothetical protein
MRRLLAHLILPLLSICLPLLALAETASKSANNSISSSTQDLSFVPDSLKPWIEWIKQKNPDWDCAVSGSVYQCIWPGKLKYIFNPNGANFELEVEVLAKAAVPLPALAGTYPRNLRVFKKSGEEFSAPFQATDANVSVLLPRGIFIVKGNFVWEALPAELPAHGSYAQVQLEGLDQKKSFTQIRSPNSLRLQPQDQTASADSLNLLVLRKVSDGSPLSIETLIKLTVAGKSRPIEISAALVPTSEAVSIQAHLPTQLNSEGKLVIQLLPGEHQVRILSLLHQPVSKIIRPFVELPEWPSEEIWSWWPDMSLRSVEITGGAGIDAALTQLPDDWKAAAAYSMKAGEILHLEEKRRGQELVAPNSISLNREIWLDLEGQGATVLDRFSGSLQRSSRINAADSLIIGRASSASKPVLITLDPDSQQKGIELRNQNLDLEVVSKVADARTLLASGWNTVVNNFSMQLNIPPAWRLIHVRGASSVSDSWVNSWSLLRIFSVIILVLAYFKLFNLKIALLLGISLFLNQNEFLAPNIIFVHFVALAALVKVLQSFSEVWSTVINKVLFITYALLLVQSLAFAKLQITEAIFPQLQSGTRYQTAIQSFIASIETNFYAWPITILILAYSIFAFSRIAKSSSIKGFIGKLVGYGFGFFLLVPLLFSVISLINRPVQTRTFSHDSGHVVEDSYQERKSIGSMPYAGSVVSPLAMSAQKERQALSFKDKNTASGPALPEWNWKSSYIDVATPLNSEHILDFYLIPPWLSRILCVVRAGLAIFLAVVLFRTLGFANIFAAIRREALSPALILCFCLAFPAKSFGQFPSAELLAELETRMQEQRCTQTQCASIDTLDIELSDTELILNARAVSDGTSFVKIPGPLERYNLTEVTINSKPTSAIRRNAQGFLEILTGPGLNLIEVKAQLPKVDSFNLQFEQKAIAVSVNSSTWITEGLGTDGIVDSNLRLVRRLTQELDTDNRQKSTSTDLPTWIKVTRKFMLSEQFNIALTVERLGALDREAQVSLELLPEEKVTSAGFDVQGANLNLVFEPGSNIIELNSLLPFSDKLSLLAQKKERLIEEWQIQCDTFLFCDHSGIKQINGAIGNQKILTFLPFQGEKLELAITSLVAAQGDFYTVENLSHQINWGTNLQQGTLHLTVRATQQATFWLQLPKDYEIINVALNGQSGQSSNLDSRISVVLNPAVHNLQIDYSRSWQPNFKELVPEIEISAPANNLRVTVVPSADRWLLWLGGSSWGPAVVFWIKMLLLIALCVFLKKLEIISVSWFGVVFLGIGLASLPLFLVAFPLIWLAAIKNLPKLQQQTKTIPRWLGLSSFFVSALIAIVLWSLVVETGLLLDPPMLITGAGSSANNLKWYFDHSANVLPTPYVISIPLWYWRVFAMIWSSWLVIALFSWLRDSIAIFRLPLFGKQDATES